MNKHYKIATIPGDGTGPEVTREAVKVLNAIAPKYGFSLELQEYDIGGDRYLKTGEILPDSVLEEFRSYDALLLGAIGHPEVKPGILEKGILLRTRFELDQYINLRPVKLFPGVETPLKDKGPEHIDYVVIRENSGDVYCGAGGFTMKGTRWTAASSGLLSTPSSATSATPLRFAARRTYSPTCMTSGNVPSTKWARHPTPPCAATTTTSTPPACGWSRARNGLT
jgi:isocitrate/isopropylmalate dehydrogenase